MLFLSFYLNALKLVVLKQNYGSIYTRPSSAKVVYYSKSFIVLSVSTFIASENQRVSRIAKCLLDF